MNELTTARMQHNCPSPHRNRNRRPSRARMRDTGPSSTLTSAELRVAELVCAGHSRIAVARRLYISVNTVGTHLSSIYAKLQVNSRMQLLLALQATASPVHQEGLN
jgi:DNA-binding CsgD family transcriptional regulator